jgi:hypothetical protein
MAHERLLTNVERCHRGMSNEHICPCCNFAPETLMHRLAFFLVNARFSLEKKKYFCKSKFIEFVQLGLDIKNQFNKFIDLKSLNLLGSGYDE